MISQSNDWDALTDDLAAPLLFYANGNFTEQYGVLSQTPVFNFTEGYSSFCLKGRVQKMSEIEMERFLCSQMYQCPDFIS